MAVVHSIQLTPGRSLSMQNRNPFIATFFLPSPRKLAERVQKGKKVRWFKGEVWAICRFWVFDGNGHLGHRLIDSRWFEKILQRKVVENGVRKKRPRTGILRGNARDAICAFKFAPTMIHSGTLCIQRKVTKFPCFGGLVFRAQFQHFLSAFWRSFFAMQLALVSMITITPTLSLSVFSLQRTRLFRTCGELWRTRGELWLYFEMQRRLDLWSFSWSSRRSREAQKWA